MKKSLLSGILSTALTIATTSLPTLAADINFKDSLSQGEFKSISKEAGAALGYRNMAPATPLGITGFDIGFETSAISINKNSHYWQSAFSNDVPSYLIIPKLRARKGLPYGIDIGASYSFIQGSNVKLYGAELSKSILDGSAATPALAIRTTYTKLSGVSDLGLQTYGVDASASKGFVFITPYAGAGVLWINSEAKGHLHDLAPTLTKETITVPRVFGGVKLTPIPLLGVIAEAEYAARPIYSFKVEIIF